MTTVSAAGVRSEREIFGHPAGLFVLFFTEVWERFSYYGMRALLVLYMVDYLIKRAQGGDVHVLGFAGLQHAIEGVYGPLGTQPLASEIYGLYTAFVYFTPLFGGMLADRILGQRKTVIIGGVLMAIGHFLMAVESMFLVALLFLILGNGCFKPNLATQVGGLYPEGDPRLDRAYTIYYAGVNLGAFFSPLVCGTLGQVYGWHYGFAAAGVGMVLGLLLYLWGQKFLATDSLTLARAANTEKTPVTSRQWKAIGGLIVLAILNIVFWMVYEQGGNTLQLFADRNANWHILGLDIPSTWYQAINPMFIFMLAPLLNMLWGWQALRKTEPSSVTKMAMGCTLLGLSFLPLIFISWGLADAARVSGLWLVGSTFIYTLGEMYLSPIGLALVVKIAPPRMVSMLMGVWYLAIFIGNYLAGHVGGYYEKMSHPAFFLMLLIAGVAAGFAIFALQRPLKNAVGHNT
jgi:POT family proton-dependent oligopeptide transporter